MKRKIIFSLSIVLLGISLFLVLRSGAQSEVTKIENELVIEISSEPETQIVAEDTEVNVSDDEESETESLQIPETPETESSVPQTEEISSVDSVSPSTEKNSKQESAKSPVSDPSKKEISKPTEKEPSKPSTEKTAKSKPDTEKPAVNKPSESPEAKPQQAPTEPPAVSQTPIKPEPKPDPEPDKPQAPAHSHNYSGTTIQNATCTTEGIKKYTCSCGDSYNESIPKTSHSWVGSTTKIWVVDKPAYNEPVKTVYGGYKCNTCGVKYSSEDCKAGLLTQHQKDTDHSGTSSWTDYKITTVKHDEEGHYEENTSYTCSVCGMAK